MGREIWLWILQRDLDVVLAPTWWLCEEGSLCGDDGQCGG